MLMELYAILAYGELRSHVTSYCCIQFGSNFTVRLLSESKYLKDLMPQCKGVGKYSCCTLSQGNVHCAFVEQDKK